MRGLTFSALFDEALSKRINLAIGRFCPVKTLHVVGLCIISGGRKSTHFFLPCDKVFDRQA
jgi:hypothetical protein